MTSGRVKLCIESISIGEYYLQFHNPVGLLSTCKTEPICWKFLIFYELFGKPQIYCFYFLFFVRNILVSTYILNCHENLDEKLICRIDKVANNYLYNVTDYPDKL